jgi:multidrug efflux pump subunit AcrB
MISRFFINRPIFASVLSIVITLAGAVSVFTLPLAQFPSFTPPTVQVTCNYPGASAQDVADAVAAPIEQQVNGVEGMMYMSSQCANDGSYNLTVTFKPGVNLNMAQVLVQNRVNLAVPLLPEVIRQTGVTTIKRSPDILMGLAVNSHNGRYNQLYLSNFALMQIKDELARVRGVGDVFLFGQRDYSMRIWLSPPKLASRNLQAGDVVRAIQEQNQQVAAGYIGQQPAPSDQEFQIPLNTQGRLKEVEQFEKIVLKSGPGGRQTLLKDVARVELGAKNNDVSIRFNGKPTVFLAIFQMPDANALDVRQRVLDKIAELQAGFPDGVDCDVAFDTTPYTSESINEVVKTLGEALVLVALVVLVFLQNWRSALIPLIAVPVAIIGTFAAMAALGFSLNNLTLFGLVLAIGIVVDDAIVVVEAVEHHIENGLLPRAATIRAMEQVSGPVIAVGLVLSAVFVPCAFISGITGQFFRQFAVTIAVSTVISTFNSLTLSPALTALLLKPRDKTMSPPLPRLAFPILGVVAGWFLLAPWLTRGIGQLRPLLPGLPEPLVGAGGTWAAVLLGAAVGWIVSRPLNWFLGWLFRGFNFLFVSATGAYTGAIRGLVGGHVRGLALLALLLGGGLGWMFLSPAMGWLLGQLPEAWIGPVLSLAPWTPVALAMAAGAAAGWIVGELLDRLIGFLFFELQKPRFELRSLHASLGVLVPSAVVVLLVYGGLLYLTYAIFTGTPKGFIPSQDMGYLLINVQLPDSASKERTDAVMEQIEKIAHAQIGDETDEERFVLEGGIRHISGISGMSFVLSASGSNFGSMFVNLKNYPDRRDPRLHSDNIRDVLTRRFGREISDAVVQVFGPPPVRGVGRAGGFALMIEDRGSYGPKELQRQVEALMYEGNQRDPATGAPKHGIATLFSVFRANVPQLHIEPDKRACLVRGVQLKDFEDTLVVYEGSLYVNDFNLFGRTWQVIVQADSEYRNQVGALAQLKVRNARGGMVPLGSLARVTEINGPLVLNRYNMYPAAALNGVAVPGASDATVMETMQKLTEAQLPRESGRVMTYEWTDMSYLQVLAGNTAMIIVAFGVAAVFLVLAALYESWSLPLAVILVVPMCLLCALAGVNIAHMDINIFVQIGFVVLIGLACKNAILIVEFAKLQREAGASRQQAALEACKLRLRPIVMTSFAFILGVIPLMLATGAGADMRKTLGTAVFSGMLGVTLFGIFLTPVFFVAINWVGESRLFASLYVQAANRLVFSLGPRGLVRVGMLVFRRQPAPYAAVPAVPVHDGNGVAADGNGKAVAATSIEPVSPKRW